MTTAKEWCERELRAVILAIHEGSEILQLECDEDEVHKELDLLHLHPSLEDRNLEDIRICVRRDYVLI